MTQHRSIHLRTDGATLAKCGKQITNPGYLTDLEQATTCLSCRKSFESRTPRVPRGYAERGPSYGDSDFPGLGILLCKICDRPCRDHRIGEHWS